MEVYIENVSYERTEASDHKGIKYFIRRTIIDYKVVVGYDEITGQRIRQGEILDLENEIINIKRDLKQKFK